MEISQYFRDDVKKNDNFSEEDVKNIILGSHTVSFTTSDLRKYKEDFYVELAQEKLLTDKIEKQESGTKNNS